MRRSFTAGPLAAAVAAVALVLSACGGSTASDPSSSAPASSVAPASSASATSSAASGAPVDAASNTVTYGNAVFERMSTIAIEPNCESPTTYLSASYSPADYSCSLTLDRATLATEFEHLKRTR